MDNALPHLSGILDRARLAGLAGANVDFADRSLARIREQLDELKNEDFNESCYETVGATLNTETVKADDALKDLRRRSPGVFFHSDLPATVTRVLRANSMAIEEAGVAVQTGFLAQMSAGGEDTNDQPKKSRGGLPDRPQGTGFHLGQLGGQCRQGDAGFRYPQLGRYLDFGGRHGLRRCPRFGHGIPDELQGKILDTRFRAPERAVARASQNPERSSESMAAAS